MKSPQALHVQLVALHRRLHVLYNQIECHKSGPNLIAALFNSNLRRQSLQVVANARRDIDDTLLQIQDVHEQQVIALFLECLQDELSLLPDSIFLSS